MLQFIVLLSINLTTPSQLPGVEQEVLTSLGVWELPASFNYGGVPSADLLSAWPSEGAEPRGLLEGRRYSRTWTAPDGFQARLETLVFDAPMALELRWTFSNQGAAPSELVTEAYAIDLSAPSQSGRCMLLSSMGGTRDGLGAAPGKASFEVTETPLGEKTLSVSGGRSSNGHLPFFSLANLSGDRGVAMALGWSGQWSARGHFDAAAGTVSFRAGMGPVNFRLDPGESVRMPCALFMPFTGDNRAGANLLRRALRTHYQATLDGQPVLPPVSFSSWFVFHNDVSAAMLTGIASAAAPLGVEYICLDAGWFEGGFPDGVGNWTVDREKFPEGLKPVADHIHALGMKFGLWFEPERVTEGTRWHQAYPELLFEARAGGTRRLLDLSKPEARRLIVDTISQYVSEVGVDWIRFDFNVEPQGFWDSADTPGRQGLAQIHYINGLYGVLSDLRSRHPALLIEQCASGGRRIDLEMARYGHTFWKSDETRSLPLMRFHETGGNTFLPAGMLNTNYCESVSQDDVLSLFAGPLGFGVDFRSLAAQESAFLVDAITAYKDIRGYLNADYYPLFKQSRSPEAWQGWLFADPASRQGVAIVYRPEAAVQASVTLPLPVGLGAGVYTFTHALNGETRPGVSHEFRVELNSGEANVWRFAPE